MIKIKAHCVNGKVETLPINISDYNTGIKICKVIIKRYQYKIVVLEETDDNLNIKKIKRTTFEKKPKNYI